jgi:putative membrane protein
MWCRPARRRLDDMSIYEIMPTATTFLSEEGERWGRHGWHPWFLVARLVFLALVITAVWLILRARQGIHGIRTLRDAYAKGEVNEAEYRERLAVLRDTRR